MSGIIYYIGDKPDKQTRVYYATPVQVAVEIALKTFRGNIQLLSQALKVTIPTIGHWRAGRKIPKARNLKRLAQVVNVPVEELIQN